MFIERKRTGEFRKSTLDDSDCWKAVLAKDTRYDGAFVYANHSAGVYCRPSCGARHPEREHVSFYSLPEAAEAAGFRPCKCCNPQAANVRDPQCDLIRKACRYIEEKLDSNPTLPDIGAHIGLSPYHLQRVFKRVMGISPRQYAEACRLETLKARLREGDSVTFAMYDAGYSSSSRLYETSAHRLGMTPATYRRGGEGMDIQYTIVESSLGLLLVATTGRGVCAVHLGGTEDELVVTLFDEYPAAQIRRNPIDLRNWVETLLDHLDGWTPHLDLPIDVQATAFQWRVWQELRAIPYGETRTYREIAEAIGQPNAASAVARAIAENPVSVIIPCHRAEREDGETTSFYDVRGAKERRALIENEQQAQQAATPDVQ